MLAAGMLYASAAMASSDDLTIRMYVQEGHRAVIFKAYNLQGSKGLFQIRDDAGNLLYTEKLDNRNDHFVKRFDFSKLATGNYTIIFETDKAELFRDVTVSDDAVSLSEEMRVAKHGDSPVYCRLKKTHLDIFVENNHKDVINVTISDRFGNEVFQNSFYKSEKFVKRFDLSSLQKGAYEVAVNVGNRRTVRKIEIQ